MAITQKQRLKNIIRTIHLWLGLASGLVVFIVAVTGALYVFEEEGRELFQHKYFHIADGGAARLPVDRMMETVAARYPGEKVTSIRFKENKDAAFIFFMEKRFVSVDPATAQIIGVREKNREFFTVVLKIHMELYMGEVGKEIVRWNVLIFLIMCISGLILWWPKQKKFFKQAVRINFKTKNFKRLNWDLHSVLGFYALIVLFIVSLTGLFWTFDTAKDIVAAVTNSKADYDIKKAPVKPQPGAHFTMQDAYVSAMRAYPGSRETYITPNTAKDATIRVMMRYPYNIIRKQNTLFFDGNTGELIASELYDNFTGYDMMAKANFNLHTGRIRAFGIGTKIIWFLAALVAASLPVTGFLVWWGRKKKKKMPVKTKATKLMPEKKLEMIQQDK